MPFTPIIGAISVVDTDIIYGCSSAYVPASTAVFMAYGFYKSSSPFNTEGFVKAAHTDVVTGAITMSAASNWGGTNPRYPRMCYDSAENALVIVFYDYDNVNNPLYVVAGTVAGDAVTFGSPVLISNYGGPESAIAYDSASGKVVVVYNDNGVGKCVVCTVTGSSISAGSPVTFLASGANSVGIAYDPVGHYVAVAYTKSGANLSAKAGLVSGTSIGFSSEVLIISGVTASAILSYNPEEARFVVTTRNGTGITSAIFGIVAGNILAGPSALITDEPTASDDIMSSYYDENCKKTVLVFSSALNYVSATSFTITETTLTFRSRETIVPVSSYAASVSYDPEAEKIVAVITDSSGIGGLRALSFQLDEDAPTNFWTNFSGQSEIL